MTVWWWLWKQETAVKEQLKCFSLLRTPSAGRLGSEKTGPSPVVLFHFPLERLREIAIKRVVGWLFGLLTLTQEGKIGFLGMGRRSRVAFSRGPQGVV